MLFLVVVLLYSCGIVWLLYVSPLLCNVEVMISTLQKCLQDALLSLVGPSSSFRIGSHIGRDNILLAYVNHHDITLYQMDIKSAFRNG